MALTPGARLGVYEITAQIGEGGMGQVYRATDTTLVRQVAIKILPDTLASDPDRLARFEREAKTLASLNHPHIAAIYGFEKSPSTGSGQAGVHALVMELVEGEDLSEKIEGQRAEGKGQRSGLPIDEALPIARQIAEALEAAHEQGIVHRDLKPANIKVRPDGTVKVLDFSLAKLDERSASLSPRGASGQAGERGGLTHSPTLTTPAMTQAGMILGTAAYMSPEQAKGSPADHRADIFSFGCVVYEMLTGAQPFEGESVSEILASILKTEPDWTRLPADVKPRLRELLRRCLEKDRKRRWPAIGDVRFELDAADYPIAAAVAAPQPGRIGIASKLALAGVSVIAIALAASTVYLYRRVTPEPVVRFVVPPPENGSFDPASIGSAAAVVPEISPDGRKLAFTARDAAGKMMLWMRPLDVVSAQPLTGTEDAMLPFWSADSQTLAFFAGGKLKRIDAVGGPVQTICDALDGRGGTWNGEGTIVFASRTAGRELLRVAAAGGQPVKMTMPGPATTVRLPSFLPDGRHFLYLSVPGGTYVGSLDGGEPKSVVPSDARAVYSAGHVLFIRQGTLLSQAFDVKRLATVGEPVPVVERIAHNPIGVALQGSSTRAGASGLAAFSASESGVLVYRTGGAESAVQLTWVDRAGKPVATAGGPGAYRGADVSHDGKRIAVHRHEGAGGDIWLVDERGVASRFTFDASQENASPLWSRDGRRIAYSSRRGQEFTIVQKPADGGSDEELLLKVASGDVTGRPIPNSWSADGKYLLYTAGPTAEATRIWVLPLQGDRKPFRLLSGTFAEEHGQISPDGRWVAYASSESGRQEIYVRPFLTGTGKWQISTAGGVGPNWTADGKGLFFLRGSAQANVAMVSINAAGATLHPGTPEDVFASGQVHLPHETHYKFFSMSPDGKRFLIPRAVNAAENNSPITVVLNWAAGLKK